MVKSWKVHCICSDERTFLYKVYLTCFFLVLRIEKEYWDVIEGRNDDWLYRWKFEKVLVKILPHFEMQHFIVDDAELKSDVRFQRYLYDRLVVKHAKRFTGKEKLFLFPYNVN